MQKLFRFFLLTVIALCMYMPGVTRSAEAADIVVLPVINNVDYPDVESTFYDNVIDCMKQQNKYNYIDNDEIAASIEKYTVKGQLPTEAALRNISEEVNADLVVAIQLDQLSYKPYANYKDAIYLMTLKGNTVSYDRSTNKFKNQKLYIEDQLDEGYYVRQNVPLRYWARTIQREMHRVMQVKGLNLQKQRIQKF